MFKKFAARVSAGSLALVASGAALATEPTGIDTTALEATISDAMTPIGAVGLAVLAVLAGILVFRLIKRVM